MTYYAVGYLLMAVMLLIVQQKYQFVTGHNSIA